MGWFPPFPAPRALKPPGASRTRFPISAAPLWSTRGHTRGKGHLLGGLLGPTAPLHQSVCPFSHPPWERARGAQEAGERLSLPTREANVLSGFEELCPPQHPLYRTAPLTEDGSGPHDEGQGREDQAPIAGPVS